MRDTDVQWHPGFVAAMNLELIKNRDDLMFEKEYNLNTKPLEIDLLVIKKNSDIKIDNEIGQLFRGHNILEYKSPRDHLDIDDFYKAGAYASLYKAYGETVDLIKADEVTVTLVREIKPEGLFRYFDEHNYTVLKPYQGIYYIKGSVLFPTQIIVTKELKQEGHIWLKALSEEMKKQDMRELLENIKLLTGRLDRELADSVLEVSIQANEQIIEELIGDDSMSQALLEIMKPMMIGNNNMSQAVLEIMEPLIEPKLILREEEGLKKGIRGTVEVLRDLGHKDTEIKMIIEQKYNLSPEEAEEYMLN